MKKVLLLLVALISLLIVSCNFKTELSPDFKGNWVSKDYIDELDKQNGDPSKVELYLYELYFPTGTDSVMRWINVGMEVHDFPFEILGKRKIRVQNFNRDPHTDIEISNDGKTLTYIDESEGRTYTFIKIDPSQFQGAMSSSFANPLINKKLIAGNYTNLKDTTSVKLSENGYLQGMDKFKGYSICISGDCRSFSDGPKPLIFLMDEKNQGFYYEWQKSGDTLRIYSLDAARYPDEKGGFPRKELKYTLLKTDDRRP